MKKAKAKPDMMARALAKAEHEDDMLAGTDPLVEVPEADEYDPVDESDMMVFNPFSIPKFVLPDPVGFQLSLCDQVDAILKEA